MTHALVGWSRENSRLYCRLKGWLPSDVHFVYDEWGFQGVGKLEDITVLGPSDLYSSWSKYVHILDEVYYLSKVKGVPTHLDDTDFLMGIFRD